MLPQWCGATAAWLVLRLRSCGNQLQCWHLPHELGLGVWEAAKLVQPYSSELIGHLLAWKQKVRKEHNSSRVRRLPEVVSFVHLCVESANVV